MKVRSVRTSAFLVTAVACVAALVGACGSSAGAGTAGSDHPTTGASNTAPADLGTAKPGVLKIATSVIGDPYVIQNGSNLSGFEIDLIRDAANKLNLQPTFVTMDFAALLPAVNNRQADVAAAAVGITADRQKSVLFTEGYLAGYYGLLTRPGTGITDKVSSVSGKKIAVQQGSIEDTHSGELIPGADIIRFTDPASAVLALINKRVDGYFGDYDPNLEFIDKYKSHNLTQTFTISGKFAPAGWAVRKDNSVLAGHLNDALTSLVKDGTWLTLYKKYFPQDPVPTGGDLPPYTASTS